MVALVAVAAFAVQFSRRAVSDTEQVIYSWPAETTAANSVVLAEGVTVAITGNSAKDVNKGMDITINGSKYTSIKNSNGAQNTLTLPRNAKAITFYSYVNKKTAEATNDAYWKEVNGVSYTAETSGGKMACFSDGDLTQVDVRRFVLAEPTNVITFNNAGYQICYVIGVEYEAPVTFDFTQNDWGFPTEAKAVDEASFSSDGYTIKVAGSTGQGYRWYPNNDDPYFLFGQSGAYIELPAFASDVELIKVVGSSGASASTGQNIFVGDAAVSTATVGAQGANFYRIAEASQAAGTIYRLKVTTAHNSQVKQIVVYKKGQAPAEYSVAKAVGIEHGDVAVSQEKAFAGESVTLTATPAEGYKLLKYIVKKGEEEVPVSGGKFTMPEGDVLVSAEFVQPEDITISPESGDITAALKAATEDAGKIAKNITINLAADGAYTISKTIETASEVTITGPEPSTLADGQKAPVINASGLGGALIKLAGSTTFAKKSDDTESTFLWYGNVAVKNLSVTGLKKQLVQTSETARIDQILLENSVVEMAAQVNVFDLGAAFYTDLTINKSTIWGTTATDHNKYLIKTDGRCENLEKVNDVYPKDVTTSIINSTLYNIARGQKLNNSNGHMKGKTYNVEKMENSILVNVGTKTGNEVNGWCFGTNSANMKMSYKNNTYITLDAEDNVANVNGWTAADKIGSDQSNTSLTTNPGITYAKAEAGDFTIGASTAQAKMKTGDPRWLVEYIVPEGKGVVTPITISPETGADIAAAIQVERNKIINELNEVGSITINLAADGAYTISKTIETASEVTITGPEPSTLADGQKAPVINASGLGGALIKLAGSTTFAKKSDDTESTFLWYGNVAVKNLSVTGLKKQLVQTSETARIDQILLENSVVEMAAQVNVFDLGAAFYTDLTINKSTIWGTTATDHNKYLIKTDGRCENLEKVNDVYPKDVTTSIINSTLYNIARGQKLNNSNGHMKGKTYNVEKMENSILVNVGTKTGNEVNGWCFGTNSANMKMSYKNNTYITLDAEDNVANVNGWTAADKIGSDQSNTSLTTNPGITYAKAEAGDFTIGASTQQAKLKTGDPRWLVDFVGYTVKVENCEGLTITPETTLAAVGEKVYATYTLAEGYQLDKPEFVDDNGDAIPFAEGQVGLEKVGDVEKMFIIMPATNVTIKAKASKVYQITLDLSQENGNATCLSVNKEKPETAFKKEGDKIYLAINPDAGYEAVISVKAGEDDVEVTAEAGTYDEQQYTHFFTMPASAVTVTVTFKNATGINSIAADKMKDATIYTIGGQRVNSAKKGLYIINGKKVVIK